MDIDSFNVIISTMPSNMKHMNVVAIMCPNEYFAVG